MLRRKVSFQWVSLFTQVTAVFCAMPATLWAQAIVAASQDANAAAVRRGQQGPVQEDNRDRLTEIVVTAQKRVENLQNVPVAAQVISGLELAQQNLNSLPGLTETVPGVHISPNGGANDMFIRGIGSGQNQSFDQSVGMFIDDIYHGRSRSTGASLLDIDRVEVLKGPQSSFFGNNAIAGALNIVTKQPGDQFDASARLLYGQFRQYAVEGAVSGPVTDTLSVRLAAIGDGDSGWIRDVNLGEDVPKVDNEAARVTLVFKPTVDLGATLKIEGGQGHTSGAFWPAQRNNNCPPPPPLTLDFYSNQTVFCAQALALNLPIGINRNESAASPGQGNDLSTFEDVLTINYRRWGQTFTSVTGFYNYHYDQRYDFDQTPLTLLNVATPEKYHQFSQEFRVASSSTDQTVEYLAGAYFQTDQLDWSEPIGFFFVSPLVESIPPFAPLVPYLPLGTDSIYSQGEHSYAVFGSMTWHVTDRLKLTAGIRGSRVDKNYDLNYVTGTMTQAYGGVVPFPASVAPLAAFLPTGAPFVLSGNRADHAAMPSAKVQYQITPDVMTYLSYARGFKAGGFNGGDTSGVASTVPYSPEYVNAYELGVKSEWYDHRLLVNVAAFRSDYTDLQVSTYEELIQGGPPVQVVRNAGASRSEGVDFEAQWVVSRDFRLAVDGEYLEAYYVKYPNASATTLQLLDGLTFQDLAGAPTDYSPKWSASAHAAYSRSLPGNYRVTADLSPYVTSRFYVGGGVGADPFSEVHPYARLDARVTFASEDEHWALDVIGKNLTNRDIPVHFPAIDITTKEQSRNIAAQIRYRW